MITSISAASRSIATAAQMISLLLLFAIILTATNADAFNDFNDLTTNSQLGKSLLNKARRLNNNGDDDVDTSWMSNYSMKFQGCHNIQQWNMDAEDDYDVRIKTARMARFRLCPSNSCKKNNSNGCGKGYGDYVVDVDTYVSAYVEAQRRQDEYECQLYMYNHCYCQDSDDMELCEYKCYLKARKYDCIEQNPYYDDDANDQGLYTNDLRDFERYFKECSEFEQDDGDRRLGQDDGDDEEITYYIGSYCADQGGKIYLGMFTDNSCTEFADKNAGRTTYKELTGGKSLPFSDYSMIRTDCVSCLEKENPQDQGDDAYNNNNKNNGDDDIRISDSCEEVYSAAGKCETEMGSHGPYEINQRSCYFINGIKIVRKDGIIDTTFTRPNKVISFFIFLFAVSFVLLGAYIYYLRMKLGMKINLE
jgi:hypothetical protein